MGLDIDARGFNLYISRNTGTGLNMAIRAHVENIATGKPAPPDWGYVYNFQEPAQLGAISLPCGMMRVLVNDMNDLVDSCRRDIPGLFESDEYIHRV